MIIDRKTYKLEPKNYTPIESKKTRIVLGHTNNYDMKHFIGWQKRLNGKYQKTAHFTISKDGNVYEHFDPKFYSSYFKYHDLNSKSIVVLLENEGYLIKDSKNQQFITWLGDIYKGGSDVLEKKWRNLNYWAPYTKEQMNSAVELVNTLCDDFNIPRDTINHNTKLNSLGDFSGILYKANLDKFYTDLNPTWDFEVFKNKIENYETKY
jgi:N-acetyl-anhydromuramyl-L-alanine amidase AmpD